MSPHVLRAIQANLSMRRIRSHPHQFIIDEKGGSWKCIDQESLTYDYLNIRPITRWSTAGIYLGIDSHLFSDIFNLDDQLNELTIVDMIVEGKNDNISLFILTDSRILYKCIVVNSVIKIHQSIAEDVICMNLIKKSIHRDNEIDTTITYITDNYLYIHNCRHHQLEGLESGYTRYDLNILIPEGVKLIDGYVVLSNANRIFMITSRRDNTIYSFDYLTTIENIIDISSIYRSCRIITDDGKLTILTNHSVYRRESEDSDYGIAELRIHIINCDTSNTTNNNKPIRFINNEDHNQPDVCYIEDREQNIYQLESNQLKKIELPMRVMHDRPKIINRKSSTSIV